MASIADNLKRLLGTTGYNIQEILENADSLGGGSSNIPSIEFVTEDDENWSLGEVKGIENVTTYSGQCLVTLTEIYDGNRYMIGQMPTSASFLINSPTDGTAHGYYYIITPSHQNIKFWLFDVAEDGTIICNSKDQTMQATQIGL